MSKKRKQNKKITYEFLHGRSMRAGTYGLLFGLFGILLIIAILYAVDLFDSLNELNSVVLYIIFGVPMLSPIIISVSPQSGSD